MGVTKSISQKVIRKVPLTEALGEVRLLVDEDLGGDDLAEGRECLQEVRVCELLPGGKQICRRRKNRNTAISLFLPVVGGR